MEKKQIEVLENGNVRVTIPLIFKIAGGRTRIFTSDSEHVEYTPVQLALARAFRWQKMIDEGKFSNIKDLAATIGVDSGHISRTIRLTLLPQRSFINSSPANLTFPGIVAAGVFPTHGRNRKRCFTINSEITIPSASLLD